FGLRMDLSSSRTELPMPRPRNARSTKPRKAFVLPKPNGQLVPRVQAVGPEHFGIVAIDCAKARSRYGLADCYGRTLLEPTTLPLLPPLRRDWVHNSPTLRCQIRELLHAAMPAYAELFCHLFNNSPAPPVSARHTTSVAAVRQQGIAGRQQLAAQAGLRCRAE